MQSTDGLSCQDSNTKEVELSFDAKVERLAQSEPFQNIITSFFCRNVNANNDTLHLDVQSTGGANVSSTLDGVAGASDLYAVMPPFEAFAGISADIREKLFFQSLEVNMVVVGKVRSLNSAMYVPTCTDNKPAPRNGGAVVDLLYCEDQVSSTWGCDMYPTAEVAKRHSPLNRYISDLNISVICDSDSMPSRRILEVAKEQVWRMVVKSIDWSTEGGFGSAPWKCTPGQTPRPKIDDSAISAGSAEKKHLYFDNLSPAFKRTKLVEQDDSISYDALLHKIVGFSNPKSHSAIMKSAHLVDCRGVHAHQSVWAQLCRSHSDSTLRSAATLRKNQNLRRALLSVGKGVTCFKEERSVEAMQHLNAALDIDPECVEGLVARGALHAKLDVFPSAISDFKAALAIKSSHKNANKYLLETYLTYAQREESNNKLLKAEKLYKDAQEFFGKTHETNALLEAALGRIEKLRLQEEEKARANQNVPTSSGAGTDLSPEKRVVTAAVAANDSLSSLDSSFDTSVTAKKIQKWLKREKQNLKKRKKKEKEKEKEQAKEKEKQNGTFEKTDNLRKERSRSKTPRDQRRRSRSRRNSNRNSSRGRDRSKSRSIEVLREMKSRKSEPVDDKSPHSKTGKPEEVFPYSPRHRRSRSRNRSNKLNENRRKRRKSSSSTSSRQSPRRSPVKKNSRSKTEEERIREKSGRKATEQLGDVKQYRKSEENKWGHRKSNETKTDTRSRRENDIPELENRVQRNDEDDKCLNGSKGVKPRKTDNPESRRVRSRSDSRKLEKRLRRSEKRKSSSKSQSRSSSGSRSSSESSKHKKRRSYGAKERSLSRDEKLSRKVETAVKERSRRSSSRNRTSRREKSPEYSRSHSKKGRRRSRRSQS